MVIYDTMWHSTETMAEADYRRDHGAKGVDAVPMNLRTPATAAK